MSSNNDQTQIIRMDYGPSQIFLEVYSSIEKAYRTRSCFHEPQTVSWIERFDNDDVFFDIGANIGAFSLIASKLPKNIRIYSFEPAFANYYKLCRNIILNNVSDKVFAFPVAFYNNTQISKFGLFSLDFGEAFNTIECEGAKNKQEFNTFMNIVSFRLDEFIEKFNVPFPNHIKIDVDGNELEIIEGASKTLANEKLKSINIEINEELPKSELIISKLISNSFHLFDKYKDPHADDPFDFGKVFNYIFIKRSDDRTK